MFFYDWLLSLNIMFLRLIHVISTPYVKYSIFYCWVIFCCMDISYFVYMFISWWTFELFPFWDYNEPCCYKHLCTCLLTILLLLFYYLLKSGSTGSYGESVFNILSNCQTTLHSPALYEGAHFAFLPTLTYLFKYSVLSNLIASVF